MNPPCLVSALQPNIRSLLRSPLYVPPRRVGPLRFVGRGAPAVFTTGTVATVSKSGVGLAVGDRQIVIHIATSTPTGPANYTQLAQVTNPNFPQILTVWGKLVATQAETTGTLTLTQAASGAQQAIILGLRGTGGSPVVDVVQTASLFQDTHNPQPIVPATAANAGIALAICCPTGITGNANFSPSLGWFDPLGSVFNSRLGFAYRIVRAGEAISGTITCDNFADGVVKNWSNATLTFKRA